MPLAFPMPRDIGTDPHRSGPQTDPAILDRSPHAVRWLKSGRFAAANRSVGPDDVWTARHGAVGPDRTLCGLAVGAGAEREPSFEGVACRRCLARVP